MGARSQAGGVDRMNSLHYFTGLFDSDGWIGRRQKHLRCVIANTVPAPLIQLHEEYGGYLYPNKPKKPQHKVCWTWEKSDTESDSVVHKLLALSLVKRAQLGWPTADFVMTDEYCAGIFDGDGTVSIRKRSKASGATGYHVHVVVYNMNADLLDGLRAEFGGVVYWRTGNRHCGEWMISCRQAKTFLRRVLPFLIIKRERAELALEAARIQSDEAVRRYVNKNSCLVLLPETLAKVDALKQKMLLLNKFGPVPEAT